MSAEWADSKPAQQKPASASAQQRRGHSVELLEWPERLEVLASATAYALNLASLRRSSCSERLLPISIQRTDVVGKGLNFRLGEQWPGGHGRTRDSSLNDALGRRVGRPHSLKTRRARKAATGVFSVAGSTFTMAPGTVHRVNAPPRFLERFGRCEAASAGVGYAEENRPTLKSWGGGRP